MAAEELKTYIETGNIKNSVNFPEAFIPYSGLKRIAVFHKNVPSMLAQISSALSDSNINIANMVNGSKKDNAYTLIEINGDVSGDVMEKLTNIQNVVRVRVIG